MHLVLHFAQKNARSSAAVYEATYGLGNDGLETSGFAVVPGTDREGAWWAVAVFGDAGISDGVVEVRNCRVGARNAIRNVRDIFIRVCYEFGLQADSQRSSETGEKHTSETRRIRPNSNFQAAIASSLLLKASCGRVEIMHSVYFA